ncbi:disease resistance protein RGA3 [Pyrus ussuriensis x Pyrus communis]|uniref:Disease resistance protein RGA3 n=1 Tax=Pyrus ussuriensis x Pyrus communis TaxID=2448454 RepID=A0A5N5HW34_9ROSA|nr:disease resistance protein RGA3 [Pyrus ussuriensis x Pyrus communis]
MAELAFDLAIRLTEKLGSIAYDEICLAWGVKSDLRKLEGTMSTIKGVLLDAEEKQANNKELRSWLRQVKNVFLDAEDVLDEFDCEALRKQVVEKFHGTGRKVRRFFSRSNPIAFRFRVAHEIKELRERLEELKANKSIFDSLTSHSKGYYDDHDKTYSFICASEVVGRGFEKEAIVNSLIEQCDDCVSVIPVVGMGGLGKTTLAKLVYNDTRVIRNFELRIWQYVSPLDFDIARLTKEILSSVLGTKISEKLSLNQLQEKLRDALKDKKFLLVLDDVWNEDAYKWGELKDLLVEGAKLGSKVLVTTRNVSVASIMGTVPTNLNLQDLSEEDCMSLFVKCAFKGGQEREHPNLFEIGKDIVRKCGGVPLAVKTLGCQLYSKTDEREWAMIRDSAIWELERDGVAHVLPALRLSYTHLPPPLKRCLACCSLLPRTYKEHDSRLLINFWMANGILESHDHGNLALDDVGELYFKELCERSFFQNVKDFTVYSKFRMHDLIHDLVRSVTQDECFTVDFEGTKGISESVRHWSFWEPAENVLSILHKQNRLRSITAKGIDINESFLQTCFSRFKYLRMLVLFDTTFEDFPSSIVSLKHMRLLDLSGNERITKLPNSVCKLQSLEILCVDGCVNLEELPRDISKLISLGVLYITTKQASFLENGVGCMKSLRYLYIRDCGNLTSLPRDTSYLAALHTLVIEDCEQLDLANGNYQQIPLRLRRFCIQGAPRMEALPEWLQGAANTLRVLCISDCENLDALPEWLTSFTSLRILDLSECPKLVSLPEGMHPLEVKIKDCPQLKRGI